GDVAAGPLPSGLLVGALGPDGVAIPFETGTSLIDPETGTLNRTTYPVSPAWNRGIQPYFWDDSGICLEAGSKEMWVVRHGFLFQEGQQLLLDTAALTPADPPIREIIVIAKAIEETDPLFAQAVTRIVFRSPLKLEHDLTRTVLA